MKKKLVFVLMALLLACFFAVSAFAGGYEGDMSLEPSGEITSPAALASEGGASLPSLPETIPAATPVSEEEPTTPAEICEFCHKRTAHYYRQTKNEDWTTLQFVDCTHSMGYRHRIAYATITAYYKCSNHDCGAITKVRDYDFYYRTYCYFQQVYSPGALGD